VLVGELAPGVGAWRQEWEGSASDWARRGRPWSVPRCGRRPVAWRFQPPATRYGSRGASAAEPVSVGVGQQPGEAGEGSKTFGEFLGVDLVQGVGGAVVDVEVVGVVGVEADQ